MKAYTILKTITGAIIKVAANHRSRTFTIKTETAKFRTLPMSKNEFNNCLYNTGNDWQQFLKSSDDYYVVKK